MSNNNDRKESAKLKTSSIFGGIFGRMADQLKKDIVQYRATLKNPNCSEAAKKYAREKLDKLGEKY